MKQEFKRIELDILKIQLNIQPKLDGWYFKRIDREKEGKLNEFHSKIWMKHQFRENLFEGLNPSFYDFDYRRPIEIWCEYNED